MIMPRVNAEEQKPYCDGGVSVLESLVECKWHILQQGVARRRRATDDGSSF